LASAPPTVFDCRPALTVFLIVGPADGVLIVGPADDNPQD
jgi:hypothetical protein